MTLAASNSRNDYVGNGATAIYSYTFKIFQEEDLLVTVQVISTGVETPLVLDTDYTVAGAGETAGGNITLLAGDLPNTEKITIRRVSAIEQDTSIRNQGSYYPESIEDALDLLTMIDQQQQDELDRSVKLPESVPSSVFDPTLPDTIVGADGCIITVNSAGDGMAIGPSVATIAADVTAAAASATAAAGSATGAAASATSATASATSATASATSATASATSATASATAAAASAASILPYVVTGTRASPVAITASGGIAKANARYEKIYVTTAGAVALTANPQIAAGTRDGDQLDLQYVGANSLSVSNGTGLASDGLINMVADSVTSWTWDTANWVLKGYNFI